VIFSVVDFAKIHEKGGLCKFFTKVDFANFLPKKWTFCRVVLVNTHKSLLKANLVPKTAKYLLLGSLVSARW